MKYLTNSLRSCSCSLSSLRSSCLAAALDHTARIRYLLLRCYAALRLPQTPAELGSSPVAALLPPTEPRPSGASHSAEARVRCAHAEEASALVSTLAGLQEQARSALGLAQLTGRLGGHSYVIPSNSSQSPANSLPHTMPHYRLAGSLTQAVSYAGENWPPTASGLPLPPVFLSLSCQPIVRSTSGSTGSSDPFLPKPRNGQSPAC